MRTSTKCVRVWRDQTLRAIWRHFFRKTTHNSTFISHQHAIKSYLILTKTIRQRPHLRNLCQLIKTVLSLNSMEQGTSKTKEDRTCGRWRANRLSTNFMCNRWWNSSMTVLTLKEQLRLTSKSLFCKKTIPFTMCSKLWLALVKSSSCSVICKLSSGATLTFIFLTQTWNLHVWGSSQSMLRTVLSKCVTQTSWTLSNPRILNSNPMSIEECVKAILATAISQIWGSQKALVLNSPNFSRTSFD